jgi:hypothetical protein
MSASHGRGWVVQEGSQGREREGEMEHDEIMEMQERYEVSHRASARRRAGGEGEGGGDADIYLLSVGINFIIVTAANPSRG